jgi:hypothetical protein
VREGRDVFDVYAIEDRSPIAVYTNGPAKIEMGTNSPLIGVSKDYIVQPSLDISLANREGWEGRINQLKELVLFLPEGVKMNPETSCNKKFVNYNLSVCGDPLLSNCCEEGDENCMACTQSCEQFVKNECLEVCDGFTDADEKSRCQADCIDRETVCKKTCDSFFVEGGQKYNGYALDIEDIKFRDESKDFEKGKLFRCRFRPEPSEVLGNAPITTKSFRVKARYDYTVEKAVSVQIDKVPEELGEVSVGDKTPSGMTIELLEPGPPESPVAKLTGGPLGDNFVAYREKKNVERDGTITYEVSIGSESTSFSGYDQFDRSVLETKIQDLLEKLKVDPENIDLLLELVAVEWSMEDLS